MLVVPHLTHSTSKLGISSSRFAHGVRTPIILGVDWKLFSFRRNVSEIIAISNLKKNSLIVCWRMFFITPDLTLLWVIYLSQTPNSPHNREMLGVRIRLVGMPWSCSLPLIFPSEAA